jgi:hypothetical protein
MADLRGISLAPPGPPWGPSIGIEMTLETIEPGFTVGSSYEILSLVVDCTPVPPRPYAVAFDDTGHLKLVDLGKLRRVETPA